MDCSKFEPLLTAYALAELDDPDRSEVAGHLARCAACRRSLDEIRQTMAVVDRELAAEPMPRLAAADLAAIDRAAWRGRRSVGPRAIRWLAGGAMAAGLMLAGGLVGWTIRGASPDRQAGPVAETPLDASAGSGRVATGQMLGLNGAGDLVANLAAASPDLTINSLAAGSPSVGANRSTLTGTDLATGPITTADLSGSDANDNPSRLPPLTVNLDRVQPPGNNSAALIGAGHATSGRLGNATFTLDGRRPINNGAAIDFNAAAGSVVPVSYVANAANPLANGTLFSGDNVGSLFGDESENGVNAVALAKSGPGNLTLSGADAYSGGAVVLSRSGAEPPIVLADGATVALGSNASTVLTLSGGQVTLTSGGRLAEAAGPTQFISLNGGSLKVSSGGGVVTIVGEGALNAFGGNEWQNSPATLSSLRGTNVLSLRGANLGTAAAGQADETVEFRDGYGLNFGSFAGQARLAVSTGTLKIGERFSADIRFTSKYGGQFYNAQFDSLLPPPARLAIFDRDRRYLGDLMAFDGSLRREVRGDDWATVAAGSYVGVVREFTAGVTPGAENAARTSPLPAGEYYLQAIYYRAFASPRPAKAAGAAEFMARFDRGELFRSNAVKITLEE